MLEKIKNIFQNKPTEGGGPVDDAQRFSVAACVLLLEVAHSDDNFSDVERKTVADILRERFSLSDGEVEELIATAAVRRDDAVDLFQFSQVINKEFTEPEKIQIMETLWRVVYADSVVDENEEFLMRRLSTMLDLNHTKMIDAKLKVRDELGLS